MSDRLDAMRVFLAVAEAGGFSPASRQLGMPLATVSRRVSDLEAYLKTSLLQRAGRGMVLTEPGQAYAAACRRILDDLSEAERAAAGEFTAPKGSLVITAPIVFGRLHVLPVIAAFLKSHAEVDVRLVQSDALVDLPEGHVDLAVRIGKLPDSLMVARSVGSIRRVVCASADYLARRGTPQEPEDLAGHDCISFENLMSARSWTFGSGTSAHTVAVRSRLIVNTAEAAIDAAAAGLGLTRVLSYQVRRAVGEARLAVVLGAWEDEPWPVSLVYPARGLVPQKVRAFVDFAAPLLKARLAED